MSLRNAEHFATLNDLADDVLKSSWSLSPIAIDSSEEGHLCGLFVAVGMYVPI
jgi:hypothetical protein